MESSRITPVSLACRGLLKVALLRQGQTLEEESMETRYLARLLYLGPPSGWQCFLGEHWACMLFTKHGASAIYTMQWHMTLVLGASQCRDTTH